MNKINTIVAAVALMSVCHANIVSLNFENWSSIPNGDTDTAGVVDAAHWNDTWLDNSNNSPMTNLRDNTGALTTMDVSWSSGGTWSINMWGTPGMDADGTWNSHLLKGYLDSGDHLDITNTTVTLSEIPYAEYDIIVYFNSDAAGRAGSLTCGDTTYYYNTYGPDSVVPNDHSGTTINAIFAQTTATDVGSAVTANYAIFSGLTGTSQVLDNYVSLGGGIAGIQVIPEPATLGLIGISGVGILFVRRRFMI